MAIKFNFKELKSSKTFWTGLGTIIGAVGGYFTNDLSLFQAIGIVVASIQAINMRDTLTKK